MRAASQVGVYGKRRSGKSTLLRIAAGIEPPDEGTVLFAGRGPHPLDRNRARSTVALPPRLH